MTCHSCHTLNSDDEHRCRHCGRRLNGSPGDTTYDGLRLNMVTGALATAPMLRPRETGTTESQARVTGGDAPEQLSFNLPRPQMKVIPFESIPARNAAGKAQVKRSPAAKAQDGAQQGFDFLPPATQGARKLKTTVEAVIYCDAPVAMPLHRAVAAALDLSMILIAFGAFLLTFHLAGGDFATDRTNLAIFGGALVIIAMFYGVVWGLANADSPGKRWTHLTLITFDGYPPDVTQRLVRGAAATVGVAALGTGVLWTLADEESLGWHDHTSKTFLTPRERDSNFFRQR
jgi:uncharacterized RDD family membrane protein YckC